MSIRRPLQQETSSSHAAIKQEAMDMDCGYRCPCGDTLDSVKPGVDIVAVSFFSQWRCRIKNKFVVMDKSIC
ncbi:hypothetical protein BH09BAC3_BH09BAC3_12380 [soil metagenome]